MIGLFPLNTNSNPTYCFFYLLFRHVRVVNRPLSPLLQSRSHAYPVRDVPPRRLARPDNLDDLPPLHAVVLGHGVAVLDAGELVLLQPVPLEQVALLAVLQDLVLGNELVVGYVDEELGLAEVLDAEILVLLKGGE